ncbi:MAG: hypothetical protein HN826_03400 [Methylococcales bacterium]|nr:hypothetical protein [Methylococcales bacterium]
MIKPELSSSPARTKLIPLRDKSVGFNDNLSTTVNNLGPVIGIDFDNTIADYDELFVIVANELKLLNQTLPKNKAEVKVALLKQTNGDQLWQKLQGQVYGKYMKQARLMPDVGQFFMECRRQQACVYIVSHKTCFGHFDEAKINLRDASKSWMQQNNFFKATEFALKESHVFFETTRDEKIERIKQLNCHYFIDDLTVVLNDSNFPEATQKILYSPNNKVLEGDFKTLTCWNDIQNAIFS